MSAPRRCPLNPPLTAILTFFAPDSPLAALPLSLKHTSKRLTEALSDDKLLILRDSFSATPSRSTNIMVNAEIGNIFKGILEEQKSTQNVEKFAKLLRRKIGRVAVYHARIYHDGLYPGFIGRDESVEVHRT